MKIALLIVLALVLFFGASLLYGNWSFQKRLAAARQSILTEPQGRPASNSKKLSEQDLSSLPLPVQTWLRQSGAVGKEKIRITRLKQTGQIRLKPEQSQWTPSSSEQIINLENPAFVWNVRMSVGGLPVLGMDQFHQGQGSIWITLFGLIPIADAGHNPKINQSALQRYLGEIIWSPTAAASPWIQWTSVDARSAKATMTIQGVSGEALFQFSESGDLEKFIAMRFKDATDVKPLEWHADIKSTATFQGFRIPSQVEATWMLPEGPFTWFKFQITDAQYE